MARDDPTVLAVLFDVDGTLVDTTYLHTQAWWKAFMEVGHDRPMSAIHKLIGMGGGELLTELLGHDDVAIRKLHDAYFEELHTVITPLPGAAELLRDISVRGARVVIVSSTPGTGVRPLLEPLGCDDVIELVIHAESADRAKPAPDLFQVALDRTGVDPDRALAVGDAVWDVEAAMKAGVTCLGVETGGTDRCRLSEAGAAEVYASCSELLECAKEDPHSLLGPLFR